MLLIAVKINLKQHCMQRTPTPYSPCSKWWNVTVSGYLAVLQSTAGRVLIGSAGAFDPALCVELSIYQPTSYRSKS